jgi:hypothetical protein
MITRLRLQSFITFSLIAAARATMALAADSPNDRLNLTTDRVIVFKDGYYLALKSGTAVTNKDGEVHLLDVPDNAVLGSVWATSSKGKLTAMVASRDTIKQSEEFAAPCLQTVDILQANVGANAKVVMHDKTVYQGDIVRVLTEPTVTAPTLGITELIQALGSDNSDANTTIQVLNTTADERDIVRALKEAASVPGAKFNPLSSSLHSGRPTTTTISGVTASQFIVRTEDGDVLLPIAQVQTVTIKNMKAEIKRTVTTSTNTKRLTMRFTEPNKPVDIAFMYFQSGLRWIPTYRINLTEDQGKQIANMDLQAEFLNEAEDLDNIPVDIVVGVPNFKFKDTPSPLTLEQTLRNVLQQAAPQLMNQSMSNSFIARSGERAGPGMVHQQENAAFALPPELSAVGAQDLFVYSLKKVKLMRGQRAAMPLLSSRVPYRDVYTWDVHLTRQDIETGSKGTTPQNISENRVWHQVVLTNNTAVPWTTGAALLMQGNQPLSQELLTYTSAGGEVRIPITVSVDTRGTYREEETARKLNALGFEGHNYAQIDKTATLNLINHKPLPIDVEITFRTGGKADEVSNDGKITLNSHSAADWIDYRGYSAVNNSSTVVWKSTIKPKETFAPTVKYHYFARH